MGSIFQSFNQSKRGLPVSNTATTGKEEQGGGIRRRLSSLSLKIQLQSSSSPSWGAFRRSKSVSSMGSEYGGGIRKWWNWGWDWILSRKPTFARDLEMNEAETAALGCHSKGSWRHVFYKVKSELGKLVGVASHSHNNVGGLSSNLPL
ncbi:hypothetical protein ACH5RR_002523 [Cinchona calisaya]|uniref:Uncharacterized protein n=1 Tax=Cinchona calisaya TaxID=153742 RepID=A0ABD3B7R5_9GENT